MEGTLIIKFEGDYSQIDKNFLTVNLIHTASVIQEINKISNPKKKIEIKISERGGGFFFMEIEAIETILDVVKKTLTSDSLGSLVSKLLGLIELRRFLNGKFYKSKVIKGDEIQFVNESNESIYVKKIVADIYENNAVIIEAMEQGFDLLNRDNSITGYEISDMYKNTSIRINSDDFELLALKSSVIRDDERVLTLESILTIIKLSFDLKSEWEFYYMGNKISAKIDDIYFQNIINKGEGISKGDKFIVELDIKQKFDRTLNIFINKSYIIRKIKKTREGINKIHSK